MRSRSRAAVPPAPPGSADLVRAYREHGYALVPGLVAPADVGALAAAVEAAPERDPSPNPLSLGPMRFASNLFYGSPELQALLTSTAVVSIVTSLLGPDSWVRWDQAVWKRPGAPAFPLHQDNGYTGLPVEHVQLWIALTPSTADNGGLVVVPGAHRTALDHRWDGDHVVTEAPGQTRTIDAEPGDAVVFSSLLPHATTPNRTDGERLAYVAEFLALAHDDPSVPEPHLVVSEAGRPAGRWAGADVHEAAGATRPHGRRRR